MLEWGTWKRKNWKVIYDINYQYERLEKLHVAYATAVQSFVYKRTRKYYFRIELNHAR